MKQNPIFKGMDRWGFWSCFALLFLLQRACLGFLYFPVMDDWFLFCEAGLSAHPWQELIQANGKLSIRPLAGLMDVYVIAPLHRHLWLGALLVMVLLGMGIYLMHRTFQKNGIRAGGIFVLLTAFYPLGLEATYWLAAAVRVVSALFFLSGASWMLSEYLRKKNWGYLIGYLMFSVFSVGFYETAIPVYFLISLYLIYHNRETPKRYWTLLIPVGVVLLIALYYQIHSGQGEAALRGTLIHDNFLFNYGRVAQQLGEVYSSVNGKILTGGFARGWAYLKAHGVYLILLGVVSGSFGFFSARCKREPIRVGRQILFGALLFLAGIGVNFLLDFVRISIRVVYFSFFGFGIMVEGLLSLLERRNWYRIFYGVLTGILCFVFLTANIGELRDYRRVSEWDGKAAEEFLKAADHRKLREPNRVIYLLDAKEYYFQTSVNYLEHIKAAGESYGAFTGAVKTAAADRSIENIIPIRTGESLSLEYLPEIGLEGYGFYILEEAGTVRRVYARKENDSYHLKDNKGRKYATLEPDGGEGTYRLVLQRQTAPGFKKVFGTNAPS